MEKKKKKVKSKNNIQCFVLQQAILEAAGNPSSESGTTKLLPQELHSASQHQATIALNCACEHLYFILIYFVYPLASCVLT